MQRLGPTIDKRIGWRHWYHITIGTYGHRLPGDERGWCERHHRKHAPGSKNHPPIPTKFSRGLHEHAKKLMKREPFVFAPPAFPVIGRHLLDSLAIQLVPVLAVCVGDVHCHLLVQCADDEPRDCAGNLKNHVYHRMFKNGASPWEKRSHEEPISDRAHGKETFVYILDHVDEGAWVWSYRDGVLPPDM